MEEGRVWGPGLRDLGGYLLRALPRRAPLTAAVRRIVQHAGALPGEDRPGAEWLGGAGDTAARQARGAGVDRRRRRDPERPRILEDVSPAGRQQHDAYAFAHHRL